MAGKNRPQLNADEVNDWTIMIYLAGDNNLSEECVFALTEMKKVKHMEKVSILAQFDPNDPLLPTQRYEINCKEKNVSLSRDIIDQAKGFEGSDEVQFKKESEKAKQLSLLRIAEANRIEESTSVAAKRAALGSGPEPSDANRDDTDTGSPVPLYNFLSYCIQNHRAKHYMAVISGHGAGTQRDFLLSDTSPAGYLTLNELKQVFFQLTDGSKGSSTGHFGNG